MALRYCEARLGAQIPPLAMLGRNDTTDGTTVEYTYDASGTPLTLKYNGATYYYVVNLQGDVTGILDSSGNRLLDYSYTAYGQGVVRAYNNNILATTLARINPFLYRGYVLDMGTGLYYLQSRYYDPAIGRFINSDTLFATGQGLRGNNMMSYCLNNPVNMVDNDGYDAIYVVIYEIDENGLPIVGHALLFIQDAQGTWYIAHFTGAIPYKDSANVVVSDADMTIVNKMIDRENIAGMDYMYLEGDFTESLSYARTLREENRNYNGYNLFNNNCAHFCKDVLLKGVFANKDIQSALSDYDVLTPKGMYYCMIDKLMEDISGYESQLEKGKNDLKKSILRGLMGGALSVPTIAFDLFEMIGG